MSRLLRRTHMYLALFLAPWMLGYALSTIVMGHAWTAPQTFAVERELQYDANFQADLAPREQARQILVALDLDGAFSVQGPDPQGRLTINRQDLLTPRRIVYTAEGHVTVEKGAFRTTTFLNRFHHRRGYDQPYAADKAMALSVDLVVVAMVFWGVSGLWMWWEMRVTRGWGAICALGGILVFGVYAWLL
jgi:hypothetical protein